ncbi:ONECUT1 [Lepeophtheirus salmonis]|uniref:ONECUT1 n=1 Tax=Lepeophtheirus salmonis TaxID=72036 RepID=A0A7R8CI31_LEPSM|nr:ONECUT1 [Lepeophtheirus salmonis]CAF2828661.1 ONECUT1 [Lepeophtheirus salmonis]
MKDKRKRTGRLYLFFHFFLKARKEEEGIIALGNDDEPCIRKAHSCPFMTRRKKQIVWKDRERNGSDHCLEEKMMSLEVDHSGLIKSEEERMSSPVVEEEEEEEEEEQEEEEEEEEQEEDSSIDKLVYGGKPCACVSRKFGRASSFEGAEFNSYDSPAKILLVRSSSHRGSHQHSHSSSSSSLAQIIASSSASSSTQPNKSSHSASLSAPSSVVAATASNAAQHEEETPTLIEEDGTITVTVGSSESNMIDASDFHRSMESGSYGGPHHLGRGGSPPSQSCYGSASSYATLTPLQPLPPISSIPSMQDKFQAYSPGGSSASGNGVQGNNNVNPFVMQNHAHLSSLGSPYHSYDTKLPPIGMSPPPHSHFHSMGTMGHHSPGALSPDGGSNPEYSQNGGLTHSKREPLSPSHYYDTGRHPSPQDLSPSSLDHSPPLSCTQNMYSPHLSSTANPGLNGMVSPGALSPHTSPGGSALSSGLRDLSPPPPTSNHAIITPVPMPNSHPDGPSSNANIMMSNLKTSPPSHNNNNSSTNPAAPSASASNSNSHSSSSSSSHASGETEEINTKDLAQRISAELKRYSIPQAIFAQRVLCRSQGTLSDLLRNPKPWSKLKSGRETFRRMQKWLSEPEFQRMSALRLAVMQQSATEKERGRSGEFTTKLHHQRESAAAAHSNSASNKNRRKIPYNSCPPAHW